MFDIDGTAITMTRGDTVRIKITILNSDGTEYIPDSTDKIRFAMKKNYTDSECVIKKEIPINTLELVIEPEDTKGLDYGVNKGKYKYDIELTKADGTIDTFIPRADFIILEEVE